MQVVLIIVTSFIVVGLIVYYLRNKEFHDNVDIESRKVEDAIKEKFKK